MGSFYRLTSGVSATFLREMLSGDTAKCQVMDDGVIDFEEFSAGFIRTLPGMAGTAVSAGESIIIISPEGTYATLGEQPAAGFLFYDLPGMPMLMEGLVPAGLTVDVSGSSGIPAFAAVAVPDAERSRSWRWRHSVSSSSRSTCEPSNDPALVSRIVFNHVPVDTSVLYVIRESFQ